MKLLLIPLLIIILPHSSDSNEFKYWEQFTKSEKEQYLSNPKVNKTALDFYMGKFQVNDDELTYALLDTLINNRNFSPLYYFLFNKICSQADGALAEVIGTYCINVIINNSEYVINYFTFEMKNLKKELYYYQLYASYIGYEMYFYDKGTSSSEMGFTEFQELLNKRFSETSKDNKETLMLFFNEIEKVIKNTD